mgnify:CR=1 FL=1
MDFLKDIVNEIGGDFTKIASEIDESETFVDTGSFIFNALVSGSLYGGVSGDKITAIAGEEATGKTFFALGIVKSFLDKNKDAGVFYFESEGALTKDLLEACFTNFLAFKLLIKFKISWSENALPSILILFSPSKTIFVNCTLAGTLLAT